MEEKTDIRIIWEPEKGLSMKTEGDSTDVIRSLVFGLATAVNRWKKKDTDTEDILKAISLDLLNALECLDSAEKEGETQLNDSTKVSIYRLC